MVWRSLAGTALGVALAAVLAAGCTAAPEAPPTQVASPFEACPATGVAAASTGAAALPAVTLPCFTGGEPVTLAQLGRPVVINFWASSCEPCRTELPELQRFADDSAGQLLVMGVVTIDSRAAAASLGEDLSVRFPAVFDPKGTFLAALGRNALPVTLFVDAAGQVRYQEVSGALTYERVVALAAEHLGVRV